tara:strand:+ start:100 stop:339 length:240 start_codon:yes stop_codon:yes gene_type:complete
MEKLHMQVSEIDALPFYEFEFTIESYNDIVEERNEHEKKQQADQEGQLDMDKYKKTLGNPSKLMGSSGMKMPSLKMPKL